MRRLIFPLLLFLAILLIFYFPVLKPDRDKIIYGGDLLSQFYYWKGYLKDSLLSGFIPFWNPYLFSGTPFLAHPATAFFYPATLLYLYLPLNYAFLSVILIHILIAYLGMFFFTSRYSDSLSAAFASAVFAFGGYFAARIYAGHIDLLTTAAWLPWVLGNLMVIFEDGFSRKRFMRTVLFLSLMVLAGYNAYLVFSALAAGMIAVYFSLQQKTIRPLFLLTVVYLAALGLTAVQWLPTWQLTGQSIRGGGFPYDLAAFGSLPLTSLNLFFTPLNRASLDAISFNLGGGPQVNPFDHFTGSLPIIAVFIYLILKRKVKRIFWLFLIVSLIFLWISLGPFAPLNLHYLLYRILPLYRFIRIPIQNLIIPLILLPPMLAMILTDIKNNLWKSAISIALITELFFFSRPYFFQTNIPKSKTELLANLKQEGVPPGRIMPGFRVISPLLSKFEMNAPISEKIFSTSGYDPLILKNYHRFADSINQSNESSLPWYNVEIPPLKSDPQMMNFLNVSRLLFDDPRILAPDFNLLDRGEDYVLYKNDKAKPRFFPVKEAVFADDEEAAGLIAQRKVDLTSRVILISKDRNKLDHCQADKIESAIKIISFKASRVKLESDYGCAVWLSSSEVYYPGWQATIDGKNTYIYKSNMAFRTIYLPAGKHLIEYFYSPKIYFYGFVISFLAVIIILFMLNKKNEQKA